MCLEGSAKYGTQILYKIVVNLWAFGDLQLIVLFDYSLRLNYHTTNFEMASSSTILSIWPTTPLISKWGEYSPNQLTYVRVAISASWSFPSARYVWAYLGSSFFFEIRGIKLLIKYFGGDFDYHLEV